MTSTDELKLVRIFRVYNTCIQLCADRGYRIRHPSALAAALAPSEGEQEDNNNNHNPYYNAAQGGLSLEWFRQHFVVKGGGALAEQNNNDNNNNNNNSNNKDASSGPAAKKKKKPEGGASGSSSSSSSSDDDDDSDEEDEMLILREAMRISCVEDEQKKNANTKPQQQEEKEDDEGPDQKGKTDPKSSSSKKHTPPALLLFFTAGALNFAAVQTIRAKGIEKKTPSVVIVSENRPRPAVYSQIEQLNGQVNSSTGAPAVHLQLFCEEELVFNPSHNRSVPPHRRLRDDEKLDLLRQRRLEVAQLPRILISDPIVMYLGLRRGDVVEITRAGDAEETRGPYFMYRQVL